MFIYLFNKLDSQINFDPNPTKRNTLTNIINFKSNFNNNINNVNKTKNTFDSDNSEMINFISPKVKDFEKSSESFFKEDKFFMTKSNINKNTTINISKKFFPDKYKKKSEVANLEESFKNKSNDSKELINLSVQKKNLKKPKIYPINHKTICEKKEFPEVKNNLTTSLNKELSRISHIYGTEKSGGKFTSNPIAERHFENRNYYAYEIAKQNELSKVNFKPKLKPLIQKEPSMHKMSKNLFFLNDMKNTIRKVL